MKWLVTNCSILYAITIKHWLFYGWCQMWLHSIYSNQMAQIHLGVHCTMWWNWLDSIPTRSENTFDTIYNFSFDSIPQDHTANIIHLIASMLSFRIAENWVWNFAKRMKDFYCHRTEINVCFGYRFRNAIQPRLNMLYSMLIKRYTEWPKETQSAFHQIYLCFFFHLKLAIDSVSCVMHIY